MIIIISYNIIIIIISIIAVIGIIIVATSPTFVIVTPHIWIPIDSLTR